MVNRRFSRNHWLLILIGILTIVLLVLPMLGASPFILHIIIMVLFYAALGQAWNILGGYAGQLSLGHTVYFGIGAYVSTFLKLRFDINPWLGLILGALLAVLFGLAVGLPTFRLKGRYFVMASIALLVLVQTVILNIEALGAASGLMVTLQPSSLANFQFSQKGPYLYLALALLIVVSYVAYRVEKSKYGYYFQTIREDEDLASSLGINTTLNKLLALSISVFFTSIAGSFFAQYVLFVDPLSAVSLNMSFLIALIVILGGSGTILGPILGAVILVPVSQISAAILGGGGQGIDLIIYGLVIVIVGIYQPDGLVGLLRKVTKRKKQGVRFITTKHPNQS